MIDFPRSFFSWKTFPWQNDPYYKYAGGFIGKEGDVRHVRFNLESRCVISEESGSQLSELFVGAPCRSEYTIPRRNFFQIPSDEFRMAFSRTHQIPIAKRPSSESEPAAARELNAAFQDHRILLREYPHPIELHAAEQVVEATLANALLNAPLHLPRFTERPARNRRVPRQSDQRQLRGRHLSGLHRPAYPARPGHLERSTGGARLPGGGGVYGLRLHRVHPAS